MPRYLSEQTLREAVDRLSEAAIAPTLADYLIFRRALKLARDNARSSSEPLPEAVITGLKSEPYVRAIQEFALRVPPGTDPASVGNPYYTPFASRRQPGLGYKTVKYPSNGPSDTVNRWGSRTDNPLPREPRSSPMSFRFSEVAPAEIEAFFSVSGAHDHFSGEKPRLLDVAIWWFRFTDLEERFGKEPSPEELVQALVDDLALPRAEVTVLFVPLETDSMDEPHISPAEDEREGGA